jgi:hypothetical protein
MLAEAPYINCVNHLQTSSLVFKGTAGSSPPTNFESTGSIKLFVVVNNQEIDTERDLFSSEVKNFLKDFNLGKDQLSKILNISRPTLNAWLNNGNLRLIETNRTRVAFIKEALNEIEKAGYAASLGPMLRKRLDEDCCRLYDALVSEKLDMDEIKNVIKQVRYRFIGQKNSLLLDKLLSNSEPLA